MDPTSLLLAVQGFDQIYLVAYAIMTVLIHVLNEGEVCSGTGSNSFLSRTCDVNAEQSLNNHRRFPLLLRHTLLCSLPVLFHTLAGLQF